MHGNASGLTRHGEHIGSSYIELWARQRKSRHTQDGAPAARKNRHQGNSNARNHPQRFTKNSAGRHRIDSYDHVCPERLSLDVLSHDCCRLSVSVAGVCDLMDHCTCHT